MFTGLVRDTGAAILVKIDTGKCELRVTAPQLARELAIGDSVAVNGCCLTVETIANESLHFSVLAETLLRTNLADAQLVNLEPALAADGRFGGHIVQGHIDCTSQVLAFGRIGADHRLEIALPGAFARYIVSKGSIAIDGISLTVAEVLPESFVVWIIPHTITQTNLRSAQPGGLVNIEFDLVAKYVERLLQEGSSRTR